MPQRKHPYRNSRSMAQRLRRKREFEAKMKLFYNQELVAESIGHYSQDVTRIDSMPIRNKETEYPSKEKQEYLGFQTNAIILDSVPVIKAEILDSSEENQELILPDYPQYVTAIDPMHAVKAEILDSFETNQKPLLPSTKVKYTQTDLVYEPLRIKVFHSESFKNREIENSVIFKSKLPKCSVLLHDCLIPENLASISASFKSLKINKAVSETCPKVELMPLRGKNSFIQFHVSEGYKKVAFSRANKKKSFRKAHKKMASPKKERKLRVDHKIHLNNIKKKNIHSDKSKYICNCSKTRINECHGNTLESAQQLCSCLTGVKTLSEDLTPIEILMKETLFFYPDFGKITCGINKIN